MENVTETDFDWSPLGEAFWTEAAGTVGATLLQSRFACCRHRGMTATGSARASGYSGDKVSIRQAGHRAAKSTAVMNLLALAKAESGEGPDGVVTGAEAKRILSRLARGSDPAIRIKALESLARMDREAPNSDPCSSHDEADSYRALEEVFGDDVAALIDAKMRYDAFVRDGGGGRPKVKPEDVFRKNSIDAKLKYDAFVQARKDASEPTE